MPYLKQPSWWSILAVLAVLIAAAGIIQSVLPW
jgi:hypothetical protein